MVENTDVSMSMTLGELVSFAVCFGIVWVADNMQINSNIKPRDDPKIMI
jgi:hypothetical protein